MIHSYPWYIQDWLLSRARSILNIEQRGLFREILDILYNNEGIIDKNEESLRRMCQAEKLEWRRSWPAVKGLLDELEGKWSHPKVRDTIEKLESYHSKRRQAGRAGAKRRWSQSSSHSSTYGNAIAQPIANVKQTDSPEAWQKDSLPQPLPQPRTYPKLAMASPCVFDSQATVDRIRKRHPKPDGVQAGIRLIEEMLSHACDPVSVAESIDRRHKVYCDSKRGENSRYVKSLANWVRDEGFLDPDPAPEDEPQDHYRSVSAADLAKFAEEERLAAEADEEDRRR